MDHGSSAERLQSCAAVTRELKTSPLALLQLVSSVQCALFKVYSAGISLVLQHEINILSLSLNVLVSIVCFLLSQISNF